MHLKGCNQKRPSKVYKFKDNGARETEACAISHGRNAQMEPVHSNISRPVDEDATHTISAKSSMEASKASSASGIKFLLR